MSQRSHERLGYDMQAPSEGFCYRVALLDTSIQCQHAVSRLALMWSSSASRRVPKDFRLQFDLHVDARGQVQPHELVDGLRGKLLDIQQPLVGPRFKVLPRVLVDVRRAQHAVDAPPAPRHGQVDDSAKHYTNTRGANAQHLVGRYTGPVARAPVLFAAFIICARRPQRCGF